MCGIVGSLSRYNIPTQEALGSALHVMKHRGPDDSGTMFVRVPCGQLVLGHVRLSIIDLTNAGRQPMQSHDGRYTLVFNGEIYNYRELRDELVQSGCLFATDSDTEVLIVAWSFWGVDCLSKLTGMFAFAIYDNHLNTLTLARDAFGIKPLYYTKRPDGVSFASELPVLIRLIDERPGIDLQSAYNFLVFGAYDVDEHTFLSGVSQLLPGHWMHIDLKTGNVCEPVRWWWPSISERTDISFEEAAAHLRELFLKNVRIHLRSDVPLGAALSGGLDSSSIVCAMRFLEPDMPIHTFSYIAGDSNINEERWIDLVNDHVGAIAHKIVVQPEDLLDDMDDMIRLQGEPYGSTSFYAQYRVFKAAKEAGITVTLDGQGADELLAGYHGYPKGYMNSLIDKHQYRELYRFMLKWSKWPGRSFRHAILSLGAILTPQWARRIAHKIAGEDVAPAWLNTSLLLAGGVKFQSPHPSANKNCGKGRRLVEQLRAALTGHGLQALLRHGDRNSMRWSVESRVPFLTTEMAEFLLSLPESYLLSADGETKCVFRAAMRGIVPDEVLDRKDKVGFQTPESKWLIDRHLQVRELISSVDSIYFLNSRQVRDCYSDVLSGSGMFSFRYWRLVNFCRWYCLFYNSNTTV